MATNKNAVLRYRVLDGCFRNPGKKYFIEDLINACSEALSQNSGAGGISRRQIFEDIAFMESPEGWNIELDKERLGKRVYYRYTDTIYSINNMPLNEMEINHLKSAVDILLQYKGMPQFEWIHELLPKLRQGILQEDKGAVIIEFDNNSYLKGIELLGTLYNAVVYKKVLRVAHQPFDQAVPKDLNFHPYYLKQYNNRWFAYGYNPEVDKYDWNLALDRIQEINETRLRYRENKQIDWNEYFEDIIGVTKPPQGLVENIRLHFTAKTGRYIESKPLHGSQKSRWLENKMLEVDLQLIINYELERLLLSYADAVSVVAPVSLRKAIREKLQQGTALNDY